MKEHDPTDWESPHDYYPCSFEKNAPCRCGLPFDDPMHRPDRSEYFAEFQIPIPMGGVTFMFRTHVCGTCGAFVPKETWEQHYQWHKTVNHKIIAGLF